MSKSNLKPGNGKKEKRRRAPKRVTETWLHNAGLYYLERFSSSTGNFRRVMMRKIDRSCAAHPDQDRETCVELLEKTVAKFRRAGLLDDEIYARAMVTSLRRRGSSARMINAKLRAKGLENDMISRALHEHDDENEDSEFAAALKLARRKKIGPFARGPQPEDRYNKALAALARAGFSYETSRKVLEMNESGLQSCQTP